MDDIRPRNRPMRSDIKPPSPAPSRQSEKRRRPKVKIDLINWLAGLVGILLLIGAAYAASIFLPELLGGEKTGSSSSSSSAPDSAETVQPVASPGGVAPTEKSITCKPAAGSIANYRTHHALAADPGNSSTLYLGVEYLGLFKSTDKGTSWQAVNSGLKAYLNQDETDRRCYLEWGKIVVDPSNGQRILAIRVESPGTLNNTLSETGGLWESLDGGSSWHQLISGSMNASGSQVVAIDPKNPKIIYYGVNNSLSIASDADKEKYYNSTGVLYKSTDGGATWEELPTGVAKKLRAIDLYIDPKNSDNLTLLASVIAAWEDPDFKENNRFSLLKSTDAGKTWKSFADKLPENFRMITEAATAAGNFSHLVVSSTHKPGEQKTFYSVDGGNSFKESNRYMEVMTFDPHEAAGWRLFGYSPLAEKKLWESKNGGQTWEPYADLPSEIDNKADGIGVSNISWDSRERNTVYMNGSGGYAWLSVDGGKTWKTIANRQKLQGGD